MCFHVQQKTTTKELTKRFNASFEKPVLFNSKETISGFDFPLLPVLTNSNLDTFQFFQWGLIPNWAKDEEIRKSTLNARIETIDQKPSFKNCTTNRCILPVTGFYEWKWLDTKGKHKEKYHICSKNHGIVALAGLFDHWTNPKTGEKTSSFTLLTTEANPLMAEIHNTKKRMPIILKPNTEQYWLEEGIYKLDNNLNAESDNPNNQLRFF